MLSIFDTQMFINRGYTFKSYFNGDLHIMKVLHLSKHLYINISFIFLTWLYLHLFSKENKRNIALAMEIHSYQIYIPKKILVKVTFNPQYLTLKGTVLLAQYQKICLSFAQSFLSKHKKLYYFASFSWGFILLNICNYDFLGVKV